MDEHRTRCPSCQIVFRVSLSQLNAAEGAVRCGICLSTFDALAHQCEVEQQPLHTKVWAIDGDEHVIDDSFDLSLLGRNSGISGPDEEKKDLLPPGIDYLDADQPAIDDLDLSVLETSHGETQGEQDYEETSKDESLDSVVEEAPDFQADAPENKLAPPAVTHTLPGGVAATGSIELSGSNSSLSGQLNELIAANQTTARAKPFRLNAQWTRNLAIVVVGLGGLMFQWILFNADQGHQQKNYASVYQKFCQTLSCKGYESRDLSAIQTKNLVVRTHPRHPGALQVDATLINLAKRSQPFPHMILTFENLEGSVLARRSFKPNEYLKGEFAGIDSIPPQQAIHFILEVVDPGEDAVSYTLIPSG